MIQTWNTIDLSENKAEIHQKWVNNCSLKNRRPVWSPINPALINKGGLETANYPIVFEPPKLATQECKVWFKPEWCTGLNVANTFDPQLISITAGKRPVGGYIDPRNPKQIVYKNAIEDGIDLVYGIWDKRHPAFEKVIVFRKCPAGEYVDIEFEVKFPGGKLDGLVITSKHGDKKISFENPVAWYYKNGKCVKNKIGISLKEKSVDRAIFTKRIPRSLVKNAEINGSYLFCDATGTHYPAASSGGTSVDGISTRFVSGSLQDWSTFVDGVATSAANSDTYFNCANCRCSTTTDCYDMNDRSFATFPTSSLAGKIVSSATLSLFSFNGANFSDSRFTVYCAKLLQSNLVTTNDYSSLRTDPISSSTGIFFTKQASDTILSYATFMDSSAYKDLVLNTVGIQNIVTNGVTQFGFTIYGDATLTPPTWVSSRTYFLQSYSADQTGTTNDPKLTTTYYPTNPQAFLMF